MHPSIQKSTYHQSIVINNVLKKTYLLLSATLLFSALSAYYAMITNARPVGLIILLAGMFGFYFLTTALRNSRWGILAIFLYTGFLGYVLGPIINLYLGQYSNGAEIVVTALGATGLVFLGLTFYAITSRKDFSYLGGLIAVGAIVAFAAALGAIFFNIPLLHVAISGVFALISSAFILYTTSRILSGGEDNYIMATISLYIAIFNLFVSLLRILSFFAGSNRN